MMSFVPFVVKENFFAVSAGKLFSVFTFSFSIS